MRAHAPRAINSLPLCSLLVLCSLSVSMSWAAVGCSSQTKLKRRSSGFNSETMYEGFIVILTAAAVQLTFGWNFHRTYVSLYREFHEAIENISDARLTTFRNELRDWIAKAFGQVFDSIERKGEFDDIGRNLGLELKNLSTDPETEAKVKELYDLVSKAREPKRVYEEVRDALKSLYKYLLASGMLTLLGLASQATGDSRLDLLYFVFLFPLMAAAFSWDTYHKAEDTLIKLRDEGV